MKRKKVKNHSKNRLVIVQNVEEEEDVDGNGSEEHVNGYKYEEKEKNETLDASTFFYLACC